MLDILTHTPVWVFALLAGLIVLGIQQTKNRHVPQLMGFFLPLGMFALSLAGVLTSFGLFAPALAAWLAGLLLAASLIARVWPVNGIGFHPANKAFYIPGSWIPFGVIMLIFSSKYCVGVIQALAPALLESAAVKLAISFLYGICSGYFVGRALCLFAALKQPSSPQESA